MIWQCPTNTASWRSNKNRWNTPSKLVTSQVIYVLKQSHKKV